MMSLGSKPTKPQPVEIFFSYSHKDQHLRDQLEAQLSLLKRQGLISSWYDHKIVAGEEWAKRIDTHLNSAHIILFLVSSDFIASDYCYNIEMTRALERHEAEEAVVIPVILRPCDWRYAPFGKLQALPTDGKPVTSWSDHNEAFLDIVRGIREVVEALNSKSRKTQPLPSGHSSILGFPPLISSKTIQQRETVVQDIYAQLTQSDVTALVLTAIGGQGKSTLAALVHRYAEEQRRAGSSPFTAESLWLTIEPTTTMIDLAETLFKTLHKPLPDFANLPLRSQAVALYNVLNSIDEARLIILDQFENLLNSQTGQALSEHACIGEWLDLMNSQPSTCRLLLTSRLWPQGARNDPPGYIQKYEVKGLNASEGVALLRKQGVEATQGADIELQKAVTRCEGHALALTLLASILRHNRSLSLLLLFNDPMYTNLWTGEIALNLLDYIYTHQLNDVQRKLLRAFSVYREPVPLDAAQAPITEVPKVQVLPALNILLRQHLLNARGEGRYQLHAIVADYAQAHFIEDDEQANQEALLVAHGKAAHYYIQQAAKVCPPRERRRSIGDVHPFIEAIWQHCQAERWQEAYNLLEQEALFATLKLLGGNLILLDLYELLLPLKKWKPEPSASAKIYVCLGNINDTLGKKQDVLRYYQEALRIYREIEDREGEGMMLSNLGLFYDGLGKPQEALKYYRQALNRRREVEDRRGEEVTLCNLGKVYENRGKKNQEALDYYQEALSIFMEVGDGRGVGVTLNNLGLVYNVLGKRQEALNCCHSALSIHRQRGDREGEGVALNNLGLISNSMGQQQEALRYYQEALSIHREVGDRGEEGTTLNNLSSIYSDLGQKQEAFRYYREALGIQREVRDREGEGLTLYNIGFLYVRPNSLDVALASFLLARNILDEVKSPMRDAAQGCIDLYKRFGEERFAVLLAQIEPHAAQIVEQALQRPFQK